MTKLLAIAAILGSVLFGLAWFFRYEPIGMTGTAWDRWTQRKCDIESISQGYGCAYDNAKAEAVRAANDAKADADKAADQKAKAAADLISKFVADVPPQSAGTERVRIFRTVGFPEPEISKWAIELREKMLAAGAAKNLVDDYFGGDPYRR